MKLYRYLLAALIYALPTAASAQCSGIFAAGNVCGNSAASGNLATSTPFSSILSRYGVTGTGNVVLRDSPALTGNPTAPTPSVGDSDTSIATTAFVSSSIGGFWQAEGVIATNTLAAPTVSMTLNASWLSLYHPSTGARRVYPPATVTANLTNVINATGAGGRDNTPTYAYGDTIYGYYIAGASGLSTINSKTAPRAVNPVNGLIGPALPAGYDAYVLVWVAQISTDDTIQYDSRQNDEASRCTATGSIATTTMTITAISADCTAGASHNIIVANTVRGTGVTPGTKVSSLGTGTGGTGTYILNKSQTVAATTLTITTSYASDLYVDGDDIDFTNALLINLTGVITFGSTFNWDYSPYVPITLTRSLDVLFNVEVSAAGPGGSTTSGLFWSQQSLSSPCVGGAGWTGIHSTYAYGDSTTPFTYNPTFTIRAMCGVLGGNGVFPIRMQSVGSPNPTPTAVMFIWRYKFRRG